MVVMAMKKQRNVLISYLLYYGGFVLSIISIVVILIYTITFGNHEGDYIHLICFLGMMLGITTPFFASRFNIYYYFSLHNPNYELVKELNCSLEVGFIQGVPNNDCSEFLNPNIMNVKKIELTKQDGIFLGMCNGENIKIDMRGWILKDRYVYELFQTYYIVQYIKKNKMPLDMIYKTIISDNIIETILTIKNNKKCKSYHLSYAGMIKTKKLLKFKNQRKCKFLKKKMFDIKDLYSFNNSK